MNNDQLLAEFDRQMRREARPDSHGTTVERIGAVVRQQGPDEAWNGVLWSDLDEDTADAAIAEQVRHFTARGQEFEWKLYAHDGPADLADRLRAAGFVPEDAEALMVARTADQPTQVVLPEGVRLLAVTDAAGVELVVRVHDRAFGTDSGKLRPRLLAQLAAAPDTVAAVVALADELPVCAARLELHQGTEFAGLWGGGTVPEWRGRGIYRALIAFRARIAAERGYRYLQVDASDQSRPILERLGFAQLSSTTPYTYTPR
jgi:GNAT superfamily N-acetyltransferase